MATNKKNKKKAPVKAAPHVMSPRQYILSGRARSLEILECLISDGWREGGLCSILVARKHKTGNVTWASYLVDIFCLGLKNTMVVFNRFEDDYEAHKGQVARTHGGVLLPIDYDLAHSIIYGAINYAAKLGFKPNKDWAESQFVLLPANSPEVEIKDIDFGKNGKPYYFAGPYDNANRILAQLNASVGEGNYEFVSYIGGFGDFNDDYDDFDDEDDEDDEDETTEIDYEEIK